MFKPVVLLRFELGNSTPIGWFQAYDSLQCMKYSFSTYKMADLKKHVQAWRCSGLGLMGAALHQQKHVVSTKIAAEGIHMYVSCLLCNRELMIGFAPKTYMDPEGRNLQEISCFFWAASDTAPKSTGYLQHFRQNFGNGHASEEDHLGMNFCRFTGHVLHFLNPKGPDFPCFCKVSR